VKGESIMQDYKPNSNRFKESQKGTPAQAAPEQKKVEKVVAGKVTAKPKTGLAKFFETFFAEDIHKVKDYIVKDVIMPTIKDTVWTIIARGSERLIFGEAGHSPKNSKLPFINYNGLFKSSAPTQTPTVNSSSSQYSVDNIILEDRGDAEKVLAAMNSYIAEYGEVSISTLYDMIGEPIGDFMSTRWGWRSLNTAGIMRTSSGGYKLDLPRPVSLK
jgi:hypothetical protein